MVLRCHLNLIFTLFCEGADIRGCSRYLAVCSKHSEGSKSWTGSSVAKGSVSRRRRIYGMAHFDRRWSRGSFNDRESELVAFVIQAKPIPRKSLKLQFPNPAIKDDAHSTRLALAAEAESLINQTVGYGGPTGEARRAFSKWTLNVFVSSS